MANLKKILVGVDSLLGAAPVLRAGVALADAAGAELHVVHVVERPDVNYDFLAKDYDKRVAKDADQALAKLLKKLGTKVKITKHVLTGSPFEEIATLRNKLNADVLVLGTGSVGAVCGRTGCLGAVASKLARKLPCDTLFVKGDADEPIQKIAVATDFSDCAASALERSVALAKLHGVKRLPVVHSYEIPGEYYRTGHTLEEFRALVLEHARESFARWVKGVKVTGVKIEPVFVEGPASRTIVEYGVAHGIDLLVIGTHGRTAGSYALLGSVAERVIRDATCSVWAERLEGHAMGFARAFGRFMGVN